MNAALIIAYKRSDCLACIVDALFKGGINSIYVAIDGPKSSDVKNSSIENILKETCGSYGIQLKIWKRTSNLGLAASVISAVDWFFNSEDQGLIIEDDLVFTSDFVFFAKLSLKEIKDNSNILMVSGNQFSDEFSIQNIATTVNYPMVWGWATSANKWKVMRNLILTERLDWSRSTAKRRVRNYWAAGHHRAHCGYMNSWAVPLAAAMRSKNLSCLLPPVNLVSNVGTDSGATHTITLSANMHAPVNKLEPNVNFNLSSEGLEYNNQWLEKYHFKITIRNIFSLYKARILGIFKDPPMSSLKQRVFDTELPN